VVTLTDDCCPLEHIIVVEGNGIVNIETNAPSAICEGETIEIEVTNLGSGTQINWRDGEGNILAEGNLTVTIQSDITFIVEAINDCGSTSEQISIQALPSPLIELELNSSDCNNAAGSANLIDVQDNWSIIWRDDNGIVIGTDNNLDNLVAGIYNVEIISNFGGINCSSNVDFNIVNSDTPEIELIDLIENDCPNNENGSIVVNVTGGQPPYEITWIDNMANIIEFGTAVNNLANGEYQLQVTDANNCETSVFYTIESPIFPNPIINIQTAFCDNDNGSIQIISGVSSDDEIVLNGTTITQDDLTTLFPGDYQLSIISSSCIIFDSLITIMNQIPFEVTGDTTIIITEGDRLPLELPFPTEGLQLSWSPNTTLSCNDCPNPIASPMEDIVYTLELFDPLTNCLSTISIQVIVEPPVEIYIPNAFSPNDDGFNDLFTIFSSDPSVLINTFQVYDRWGGLVYESENNEAAWDGKANGKPIGSGVFVYFIQIQLPNGEQIIRKGDLTLLR
jgi:gliding motility-associated-like protein